MARVACSLLSLKVIFILVFRLVWVELVDTSNMCINYCLYVCPTHPLAAVGERTAQEEGETAERRVSGRYRQSTVSVSNCLLLPMWSLPS